MDLLSFFRQTIPSPPDKGCRIYNLTGSSAALFLALETRPFVALGKDETEAETLWKDICFYRSLFSVAPPIFFPDPDGAEMAGKRAEIIHRLKQDDSLVTSAKNLSVALGDKEAVERDVLTIKTGDTIGRELCQDWLISLGYMNVPMVSGKGEYSRREWIIDVFPSTSDVPVRLEFFGDDVEQIRSFEVDSQRSQMDLSELLIYPAREADRVEDLSKVVQGRRWYCLDPLLEPKKLPEGTVFLSTYSFRPGESESMDPGEMLQQIEAATVPIMGEGVLPEERKGIEDLAENLSRLSQQTRIFIIASSMGQAERLRDIFREHDQVVPVISTNEVASYEGMISIVAGRLSAGLFLPSLILLTEKEIFGNRPSFRPMKRSAFSRLLTSIDDISIGDFVVHREHGIGRFTGVIKQASDDAELELMVIEYEGGRIYIPIHNIEKISKFRADEGAVPKVDSLGGKTWQRKKERARRRVAEIAAKLIALYAERSIARGFTFSPDSELHREFNSFFAYEETPDQLKAIGDIKSDMESEKPMDRLLCGDVGYGKTEVAMRAAFKAIFDHRQVAVLVPTTILAEQHYRTFQERFSGFPVKIDFISRFKSAKENTNALKRVASGETDIIIGTHGLLAKRVIFKWLGILIVDEEHRFGVSQKEKIKEMSRGVDVLNITATPIPRSLHMALSGIRDISVIETPPEERLSVKSIVSVFDDGLIRDALNRELQRNGQVFFVHNRIHDIHKIADHLRELVPQAKLGVAHGQMPERELEAVMHRFFSGEINILLSTAIVGAGLDIPRANTIIINRADRMGLADLYQLRGRVGRSSLKGYAFFLAPPESLLTDEAKQRLQAIQEMSYLGAGFRLALKDLEIRGAGDIFGAEQSGHINEIGFDLYIEMLEQAVAELQGIEVKEEREPAIEMQTSAFIPEEYVADISLRLGFYRRIAAMKAEAEIDEYLTEVRDRFGVPPAEVVNLLNVARLKLLARGLSVVKVRETEGRVRVIFAPDTAVKPELLFALNESMPGRIKFLPDGFELLMKGKDHDWAFRKLYEICQGLLEKAGLSGR